MNKEVKKILKEDIRDLENLIQIYSKGDNDYKVAELEKELERMKKAVKNEQRQ